MIKRFLWRWLRRPIHVIPDHVPHPFRPLIERMAQVPNEGDFGPSELGTQEYWDKVYEQETVNYEDHGDIGEIWFGVDSVDKIVEWVQNTISDTTASILDLGCGNGHLLLELASLSYTNLTGIDYSASAVQLARSVAQGRELAVQIRYETVDFLADLQCAWNDGKSFNVVLDKGTYDAICLNPAQTEAQERGEPGPADVYLDAVRALVKGEEGWLLVTSCNWTREELVEKFRGKFDYHSHIHYPTFTFGGVSGSKICTVAFKPKRS